MGAPWAKDLWKSLSHDSINTTSSSVFLNSTLPSWVTRVAKTGLTRAAGSRARCPLIPVVCSRAPVIVPCGPSSVWPRWADGRLHPAACCSAAPPMRGREPRSPDPMRAAGSGLGLRVGLFNLWGEQQSAPSVPDGCVVVMVTLPSFFPISSVTDVVTNTVRGSSLP